MFHVGLLALWFTSLYYYIDSDENDDICDVIPIANRRKINCKIELTKRREKEDDDREKNKTTHAHIHETHSRTAYTHNNQSQDRIEIERKGKGERNRVKRTGKSEDGR